MEFFLFFSRFLCSAFLFSFPIIVSLVLYWKCCTSWKNSHPFFIILLLLCPLEVDAEKSEEETNIGRYEDTRSVFYHVETVSLSAVKKEVMISRKNELEINE